jgi:hypothetical protein
MYCVLEVMYCVLEVMYCVLEVHIRSIKEISCPSLYTSAFLHLQFIKAKVNSP